MSTSPRQVLHHLCLLTFMLSSSPCFAEVTTDGSLGSAMDLTGPNFEIPASLGQQIEQRLFHSFSQFNLAAGESANFSGPDSIQAIFARVTGGNPSSINGLLSSSIPTADLYLLNPAGIVFHEQARLDVQGSFYASTADAIQFADGSRFSVDATQAAPLLSTAPVEQFGFLNDTPASIEVQGSTLSVPSGETLALIGGDIRLTGDFERDAEGNVIMNEVFPHTPFLTIVSPVATAKLAAPSGQILLLSQGQAGSLSLTATDTGSLAAQAQQGGSISLNRFFLETGKQDGGHIVLFAKDITQVESYLQAIALNGDNGSTIQLVADVILLEGNDIGGGIFAQTENTETGAHLDIKARQLTVQNGIVIITESNTYLGRIDIDVAEDINFSNKNTDPFSINGIFNSSAATDTSLSELPNYETDVFHIHAGNLYVRDASIISGISFGAFDASDITVDVDNILYIEGGKILPVSFSPNFSINSGFVTNSYAGSFLMRNLGYDTEISDSNTVGKSGNINITAKDITVREFGVIVNNSYAGHAGNIQINADTLSVEDGGIISTAAWGLGSGGNINIELTDQLNIVGTYDVFPLNSRISAGSVGSQSDMGDAGTITISADKIYIADSGEILTNTDNSTGGNLSLSACTWILLEEGKILTSAGGDSNGGNILITQPIFFIANQGEIKAQAEQGQGGNIHIEANNVLKSANTTISASSRLGIDGKIEINNPDEGLSNSFIILASDFFTDDTLNLASCSLDELTNISQFFVNLSYQGKLRGAEDFQE